jgi:hypothetical protein
VTGDCHARICGSPGVKFPWATRPGGCLGLAGRIPLRRLLSSDCNSALNEPSRLLSVSGTLDTLGRAAGTVPIQRG